MPSAVEIGFQPFLYERKTGPFPQHVAGKAQNVGIGVLAAECGGYIISARHGPDIRKFVGDDAHSDSCSANQNSVFRFSAADQFRDLRPDFRVIDDGMVVGTEFRNIITVFSQVFGNNAPQAYTSMITSQGYSHFSVPLF